MGNVPYWAQTSASRLKQAATSLRTQAVLPGMCPVHVAGNATLPQSLPTARGDDRGRHGERTQLEAEAAGLLPEDRGRGPRGDGRRQRAHDGGQLWAVPSFCFVLFPVSGSLVIRHTHQIGWHEHDFTTVG